MSEHLQLVIAAWLVSMTVIAVGAFLGWLAWSLFWDLYDHLMQQRTRKRNAQFDARASRDCFRDMKGITR